MNPPVAEDAEPLLPRAQALLHREPVFDGHNDLAWAIRELSDEQRSRLDLTVRGSLTHTDFPRLAEGRVGTQFWSVYVPADLPEPAAVPLVLEQIDLVHRMIEAHPDVLELAASADDVERIRAGGRIASLLGAEGGQSIGSSLAVLRILRRLGVRYMTLTHNHNTPWADSATDEPRSGGLAPFGREVVREMNALGVIVDLAHVSPRTMHDALDESGAPVLFTHSSCRALVDHPRNVPDDVLARLPANGGVLMVAFVPEFVSTECREWSAGLDEAVRSHGADPRNHSAHQQFLAGYEARHPRPAATVADVADHLEHAREIAGIEHVGIGGDYDGCDRLPVGLEDVSGYPRLFAELLRRGWSERDCALAAARNALRVLRDNDRPSQAGRRGS